MMRAPLLRYATRSLRRGGQRGLVAILSVTFGVMAFVALATLTQAISTVLLVDPAESLGGDPSHPAGGHAFAHVVSLVAAPGVMIV